MYHHNMYLDGLSFPWAKMVSLLKIQYDSNKCQINLTPRQRLTSSFLVPKIKPAFKVVIFSCFKGTRSPKIYNIRVKEAETLEL